MCTAFFSQDYDNFKMPQIVFLQPVVFELQTKMFQDSLWEKLRFCKNFSRNYNELSLVMKVSKQKALHHSQGYESSKCSNDSSYRILLEQKVYANNWQAKSRDNLIRRIKMCSKNIDIKLIQDMMDKVKARCHQANEHGLYSLLD